MLLLALWACPHSPKAGLHPGALNENLYQFFYAIRRLEGCKLFDQFFAYIRFARH
jgi:hypothetical protein